ncbi:serine hydrolase [Deinococcus radiophilus]|uniref:Serine hydrolase n=1 Tax=Deinococcus radiophilus TaxID=32062 RepID=A0A431W5S9_9DEIO|nr:serine hydrolase [Deinococcus radiophilus]RTR30807.1 serine hydrolase [Deinococcus radiophilus]UFA49390.1 serine hydrolase [Deinococcus radiophilus]
MPLNWPSKAGPVLLSAGLALCGAWVLGRPAQSEPSQDTVAQVAPPQPEAPALAEMQVSDTAAPGCLDAAPPVAKAPQPPYALSGRLGLWVAEIDPNTLQVLRAVGTNPDSVFPLASTYKQAVLWAVLREFDAGRLSPEERFDVTEENQSLGDFPYDGSNTRALTERMIRYSDNTATDILHRRVGLDTVQALADDLHLCHTRIMLPTKDWWVMQAGLSDTYLAKPDWWQRPDRSELAQAIDAEAQKYNVYELTASTNEYFEGVHQPEDELGSHNVSTPYEFSTLLAQQYLRSGLSERAQRWQDEVARTGHGRASLKAGQVDNIETFYGKGGNGWRLLTYTGYFKTKDGRHVVYSFMQHGSDEWYTMPNTHRAFAWINAAVDEVIGEQKQRPKPQPVPAKQPSDKNDETPGTPVSPPESEAEAQAPS